MIVKVWSLPAFTRTAPLGEIDPPEPAVAVIVKALTEKVAPIVWFAWTLVKV